jgi:hypothetical protein
MVRLNNVIEQRTKSEAILRIQIFSNNISSLNTHLAKKHQSINNPNIGKETSKHAQSIFEVFLMII